MTSPFRKIGLVTALLTSAVGFLCITSWTSSANLKPQIKPAFKFVRTRDDEVKERAPHHISDRGPVTDDKSPQPLWTTDNITMTDGKSRQPMRTADNVTTTNPMPSELRSEIESLAEVLRDKLEKYSKSKRVTFKPTCNNKRYLSNSCDANARCLQKVLPEEAEERVSQLVAPKKLRLTPGQHQALREMAEELKGKYDVIILTAASSNHYLEAQALLKNLHEKVFPYLRNFTMVFYDIGLTPKERSAMVKFCKCTVLDFPFDKFPEFVRQLKCYSWKPLIIKSQLQNANVVIWADASVRFIAGAVIDFVDDARRHGAQIGGSYVCSPLRTARSMYHYFGDEPCAYFCLGQARATVGAYHNEAFVNRAILEPWVACALHQDCMCPTDLPTSGCAEAKRIESQLARNNGPITYGACHRFDQSAISLIIHKLYQQYYKQILVNNHDFAQILRRSTENYFPKQ